VAALPTVPKFLLGDDCLENGTPRHFLMHTQAPVFVMQVMPDDEKGVLVFSPIFLRPSDASAITPAARDALFREAVTYYNQSWRRLVAIKTPA